MNSITINAAAPDNSFVSGAFYVRTATADRPGRHVQEGDVYQAFEDAGAERLVNVRTGNTTTWTKVQDRVERLDAAFTVAPQA